MSKQNIARDIEIKNKLTVTREEGREEKWGKIEEGPSRNLYKGHLDKAKGDKVKIQGWEAGMSGVG